MTYLGKKYSFEKHEKFDEFLKSFGVSKPAQDAILSHASSQTLVKDGDSYIYIMDGYEGVKNITFKSGVEFDEKAGPHDVKSTITVDGNVVVQTQKYGDGRIMTFKKEYSDDKLIATATHTGWDGVARRYYKA